METGWTRDWRDDEGEVPRHGAPVRIMIADDHALVRMGIGSLVTGMRDASLCGEADSSTTLMPLLERQLPDILVTDLMMPGGDHGDGVAMVAGLRRRYPALKIIVLTMLVNPAVLRLVLDTGVHGLLLKCIARRQLALALRVVAAGGTFVDRSVRSAVCAASGDGAPWWQSGLDRLSRREREVLLLCLRGLSVTEIAGLRNRSIKTISQQKVTAFHKLGLGSDRALFEFAEQSGLMRRAR